jgi:antirestriction protein ArdC
MTFKQAVELNAHVRKGEKGSLAVYANSITRTEHDDDTGEDIEREIPFLKGYTVFNVEQIYGLPEIYYAKAESQLTPVERIARAEEFFKHIPVTLKHVGNRAYYAQELDYVQMPIIEAFRDAESYYATLGHEFIHSTRHPTRLTRNFGRKTWGDEGYAREELVAELGSAFLCADLELTPEVRDDHAGYIANWLEVLKDDKRCVVQAASYAQKAVDYLHGPQPQAERDPPEYRCHSPCGTLEGLKIFRKSSRKGIATANRMPLKTRVVTKIAGVFQNVWVRKQPSRPCRVRLDE